MSLEATFQAGVPTNPAAFMVRAAFHLLLNSNAMVSQSEEAITRAASMVSKRLDASGVPIRDRDEMIDVFQILGRTNGGR
jgi:hypothetical protein